LKSQGVNDRAQHAHVIACGLLDADFLGEAAPPNVARAHHDADMDAQGSGFDDRVRDRLKLLLIEDRFVTAVGEGFARQFEDDGLIFCFHSSSYYTKNAQGWCALIALVLLRGSLAMPSPT
jgi:hypothetical protein